MSKKDKNIKHEPSEPVAAEPDEQNNDIKLIEKDLEKARSEACDYLDNLQRLKAEFDNFRKRMLKEQSVHLVMASQNIIQIGRASCRERV